MLKEWMTANGYSRRRVAEELGLSETSISRICMGIQTPTPELAVKLESLTEIPAWEWVKPAEVRA